MTGFLFVDRITAVDPGRCIEGSYAVPEHLDELSPCLVAEAIGQLAAWAAMAHAGFARRPVAALATTVDVPSSVRGGAVLMLAATLETCDADAVAYNGTAHVDGKLVLALRGCVGAMLTMEEFDDPQAVRARFESLHVAPDVQRVAVGAAAESWTVPDILSQHDGDQRVRGTLHVPQEAPYFADHFPRQAVFPATLLLDAQLRLAHALVARLAADAQWPRPMQVRDVKLRTFIAPGEQLDLRAEVLGVANGATEVALLATAAGKRVASARCYIPERS